jgi:hypothetical protein
VVTSSDAIVKCSGSGGTHGHEQVPGTVSVPLQDPPARVEVSHGLVASVVDVALSGHVGVVNHGNVCGLLTRCLQDVCFTALHIPSFAVLLLTLSCF